jgi:hypothetical protein
MTLQVLIDHLKTLQPEQFNMNNNGYSLMHYCGTAACIGGWACYLLQEPRLAGIPVQALTKFAGVPLSDADLICFPQGVGWSANPTQAVVLLENYQSTGVVDWKKAMAS